MTRGRVVAITSSVFMAAVLLGPGPAQAARGFSLGVAAGEVGPRGAKIWAHSDRPGGVRWRVATDRRFRSVAASGRARARGANNKTVQAEVGGLRPGTSYFFRFQKGRARSQTGRFETAPRPRSSRTVRFALTGDADPTPAPGESAPYFGNFRAFRAMAAERNDFNVFMGDTIYSDTGVAGAPALTVRQKWAKYREDLQQRNLLRVRRQTGLYSHWDDHEFINDFSVAENGSELYEAGVKAFTDYAPVGYSERKGLYRRFRWGRNLELFFLDERSFRSAKASAGGTCDNPDTNAPDLAPTAPDSKRALFSLLIPSLAQPVSQACKDAINDPERTLLGRAQLNRFIRAVSRSKARWKIVMNETPLQQFYGLPYDRWEGYAHERVELMQRLADAGLGDDLVFMTTDTHAAFANIVRERTFGDDVAPANAAGEASDTPFYDYIIGPVATNTFWAEIDDVTGSEGNGELLSAAFFKPMPPDGVGMLCAQGDQNSYAEVTASKNRLTVEYKSESGGPVADVDDSTCGPYVVSR